MNVPPCMHASLALTQLVHLPSLQAPKEEEEDEGEEGKKKKKEKVGGIWLLGRHVQCVRIHV